jgi:hypothetical protein
MKSSPNTATQQMIISTNKSCLSLITSQTENWRLLSTHADNAARAVLKGQATAVPKSADGTVEMIRLVKVAKDVAVKGRTSAMISLKAVLVNAPVELREQLQPLTKMALIRRCAALRPGPVTDPTTAAKHTLRAIARRWLAPWTPRSKPMSTS